MKKLLARVEFMLCFFMLTDANKRAVADLVHSPEATRSLFFPRYGLPITHVIVTLATLKLYPPDVPMIMIPITWAASFGASLFIYKGISQFNRG